MVSHAEFSENLRVGLEWQAFARTELCARVQHIPSKMSFEDLIACITTSRAVGAESEASGCSVTTALATVAGAAVAVTGALAGVGSFAGESGCAQDGNVSLTGLS